MKNLLITTIGKYNHADVWIRERADFDSYILDYTITPGFKYPLIYEMLGKLPPYDYYWMPDEDVYATPVQIERIFKIMADNNLHLAQPSIEKSSRSFPSWPQFIHDPAAPGIVPTDFVEVTCPCFSYSALMACVETFPKSKSGWGLDLVWPKLINYEGMAVLNSIVVRHTRPVKGGQLYRVLKEKGINCSGEMRALKKEYGIF